MSRAKSRAGRPPKLTPEVEKTICSYIRAGAFAWVAAAAAGVGNSTFMHWMADPRPLYRKFQDEVGKAKAAARLSCEVEVKKTNPVAWLRLGPGRDKPGQEGWTESAKVEHSGEMRVTEAPRDLSKLSLDELKQLRALVAKTGPKDGRPSDGG